MHRGRKTMLSNLNSQLFSNKSNYLNILHILKKPIKERTHDDILELVENTKQYPFFVQLNSKKINQKS